MEMNMLRNIVLKYNQDHIEQAQKMAEDEGIEFMLAFSDRWNNDEMIQFKPREEYCLNQSVYLNMIRKTQHKVICSLVVLWMLILWKGVLHKIFFIKKN